MEIVRELTLEELVFTLMVMLLSPEGEYWWYYWPDPEWWELRLLIGRN